MLGGMIDANITGQPRFSAATSKSPTPFHHAFTLIELLVTVSIIAVLSSLVYAVTQNVTNRARKVHEVAAARNLVTGFLSTPADYNGHYLLGYDETARPMTAPGGKVIAGELLHRYPYRLAPYFDWQLKDTILVNSNVQQVGGDSSGYQISLNPALGMNIFLVGGELRDATAGISWPGECLTMPGGSGASLLVFASAGYDNGGTRVNGYFKVTPPKLGGPIWNTAAWTTKSRPADYGQVDARYDGQAVCAFTDGSVRTLSVEELRDMRLWARVAAEKNDKDYTPVNQNAGDAGM